MSTTHFEVGMERTMRDLSDTFRKWNIEIWDVQRRYRGQRRNGLSREERRMVVWWETPAESRVEIGCDEHLFQSDNLRAIWYAIESARLNEKRGVGLMVASVHQQLALAAGGNGAFALLELEESATLDQVHASYRRLARERHPDAEGGSDEAMKLLNEAYEEAKERARPA